VRGWIGCTKAAKEVIMSYKYVLARPRFFKGMRIGPLIIGTLDFQ
jgi:hypothetical protein